jgi:pimeloyl-ACP methyl ester carboxylesterase
MGSVFEHRVQLVSHATRALEVDGNGPGIVLLHGWRDSADTWRPLLRELSNRGRRAIAVDLPGFGTASRLAPDPILPQLDRFAHAVTRYAAGRERTPVIVAGNSLGGCVALRLAERHPAMLAGIVGAAPAGLEMHRLLHLVQHDPLLRSLVSLPSPVPAAVMRAAVARIYCRLAFAAPATVDPAVISAFTYHHRRRQRVAEYLDIAHRLIPELRAALALDRIRTPLLLIWGDRDRMLLHRGAQKVLEAVPGSRLELLPGIGHCPQVEAAERFTELLLGFAAEHAPGQEPPRAGAGGSSG